MGAPAPSPATVRSVGKVSPTHADADADTGQTVALRPASLLSKAMVHAGEAGVHGAGAHLGDLAGHRAFLAWV